MGTPLLAQGFKPPLEVLNLTHPELVRALHQAYFDAGARVICTNTFGAHPLRLKNLSCEAEPEDLIRQGVALARAAVGQSAYVTGSAGPSGLSLNELKTFSAERLKQFYSRQVTALAEAGVDLIVFETFYSLTELRVALLASQWAKPVTMPLIASVTVQKDGSLADGTPLKDWVGALNEALSVDVIGLNCGFGPQALEPVLETLLALASKPLFIKPNAGLPQERSGQLFYPFSPQDFAASLTALHHPKVRIYGGCCGTTPEFIRELGMRLAEVA